MRVELHCHSTCSDGSDAPAQVAMLAREAGVELFCLTDHDTTGGFHAARAAFAPGRSLRAVELSCTAEGRTVHLLAYDVGGGDWSSIEARLDELALARVARLRDMGARLRRRGIDLDIEQLLQAAGNRVVGRPDLARAMVAAGAVGSLDEAFRYHLYDGGPVVVPMNRLEVTDALAMVHAAKGRASIAHPHTLGSNAAAMIRQLRERGLEAIEALYGMYTKKERRRWLALADQLDLVATGGSDYHGDATPAVKQPGIEITGPRAERLRAWLELD